MRTKTILLYLLLAAVAFPQGERCTITGTVTDSSSAIIPGVRVSVRNIQTNSTSRAETNTAGIYYVTALPPGDYEVNADKTGFARRA